MNSDKIYENEKDNYRLILNTYFRYLKDEDIFDALKKLSNYLCRNYESKVYVLIDEYDAPLNCAFRNFENKKEVEILTLIYSNIFSSLVKTNPDVEKSLITGTLQINKAGFLSDLNSEGKYTLAHPSITVGFYGFTEQEVDELIDKYDVPKYLKNEMKEWYNGYNVAGQDIYNPCSIILCLQNFIVNKRLFGEKNSREQCVQNYCEESGSINVLSNLFKSKDIRVLLLELLNNEVIEVLIEDIDVNNYWKLTDAGKTDIDAIHNVSPNFADLFFNILFQTGYLTPVKGTLTIKSLKLKIPNEEIKEQTLKRLKEFYVNIGLQFSEAVNALENIFLNLQENMEYKFEIFRKAFENLLQSKNFPQIIHIKNDNSLGSLGNEDIVHSVLNIIAMQVKNQKFGEICKTKGIKGRTDIVMIHINGQSIIIEVKYNKSAQEALTQCQKYRDLIDECKGNIKIKSGFLVGINVDKSMNVTIQFNQS